MAKAKKQVTEEVKTEPVAEETAIEVKAEEPSIEERFISRKLTVINRMNDRAKAKRLAERVLMNNRKDN